MYHRFIAQSLCYWAKEEYTSYTIIFVRETAKVLVICGEGGYSCLNLFAKTLPVVFQWCAEMVSRSIIHYSVHLCFFGMYVFISVAHVQYPVSDFAMNDFILVVDMKKLFLVTPAIRALGSHLDGDVSVPVVQSSP